ncbi:hypothetical protein, partial [Fusobacterium varium]|uniref:hypothetical protein n=1 Tax=Fusobacterium varium TaxID=856 RepID=UPI001F35110E
NKFASGKNITISAKDLVNNKTLGSLRNFAVNLSGKLDNLDSMILGNGNNIITTAGEINMDKKEIDPPDGKGKHDIRVD